MVTFSEPIRVGPRTWRLSWSSDLVDPTFRVYRDGVLIATTRAASITVTVPDGQSPTFEVLDDADTAAAAGYPGQALLFWQRTSGADKYRVEELVGAVWTPRGVVQDFGRLYH